MSSALEKEKEKQKYRDMQIGEQQIGIGEQQQPAQAQAQEEQQEEPPTKKKNVSAAPGAPVSFGPFQPIQEKKSYYEMKEQMEMKLKGAGITKEQMEKKKKEDDAKRRKISANLQSDFERKQKLGQVGQWKQIADDAGDVPGGTWRRQITWDGLCEVIINQPDASKLPLKFPAGMELGVNHWRWGPNHE